MDNAAKALLIAGGILLSIIVLSLFMLMLNSLTDYQQAQTQIERNQDVISFNNQFVGYLRDGISGSDIVSLINKVTFYNKTKSSVGEDNKNYAYEPIKLVINLKGHNTKLAMDGLTNKLFIGNDITIDATSKSVIKNGIDEMNSILKATMPKPPQNGSSPDIFPYQYQNRTLNLRYTEEILQGLLDNYNSSESIFADNFCSITDKDRRKRFSNFNIIVGQVFFPLINNKNAAISDDTIKNWWNNYFSKNTTINTQKDSRGKTIREELAYYYEYKQFQRGIFNYVQPTGGTKKYSDDTGRIIYMEFDFTGEFI